MTRLSQRQPWYSRLWQIFLRDRLGIFALMVVVSGFVCLLLPVGAVQGIGGILFGSTSAQNYVVVNTSNRP